MKIISEVILERRASPQPAPAIYPGGDCGPCCLAGLLGLTPDEVYAKFIPETDALSWSGMFHVMWQAYDLDLLDRLIDDVPYWPPRDSVRVFGSPGWMGSLPWFKWIRMGLDAGYYAITPVSSQGEGPLVGIDGDHWVMICGARSVELERKLASGNMATVICSELLVSCSATSPDGYWIDHLEFLQKHGGFNALLVRPS